IRSAVDFFPLTIRWFMNFARRSLPNLGSGMISGLAATLLLGMISPLLKGPSGKLETPAWGGARPYSYQTDINHVLMRGPRLIRPWDAWRRTWNGPACGSARRRCPGRHARCGNARREGP